MTGAKLILGDSRDVLKTFPDNHFDSIVTDPPYALVSITKRFGKDGAAPAQYGKDGLYSRASAGFMNAKWDTGEVAFSPVFWAEVLRVAKPGAWLAAFGGTRSHHRLACAIEDAGWEIRDSISYLFGSGFPKNGRVALKPANEPICIARKPLSESSVAANVLKWGTGGINIAATRVGTRADAPQVSGAKKTSTVYGDIDVPGGKVYSEGRWPPNVILDSQAAAEMDRQSGRNDSHGGNPIVRQTAAGMFGLGGDKWRAVKHCDSGGASRFFPVLDYGPEDEKGWPEGVTPFFYTAKPSQRERNVGCDELPPSANRVRLRDDLTPEQREYVMRELEAAGVRT